MTTAGMRKAVSLVAIASVPLLALACSHTRRTGEPRVWDSRSLNLRFENETRARVQVYLVSDQREWLLGRVESGAVARLSIPEQAVALRPGFVRLLVIADDRTTLQASRHGGAATSVVQPLSAVLSHQWRYAQGQLLSSRPRPQGP